MATGLVVTAVGGYTQLGLPAHFLDVPSKNDVSSALTLVEKYVLITYSRIFIFFILGNSV